jgi:hypothetical protein
LLKELHGRLVAAGINPLDPKVQAISEVVNAFYAEKTREVLQKMQEVLSRIETRSSPHEQSDMRVQLSIRPRISLRSSGLRSL